MADSTTIDFTTNQGGQGLAAKNPVVVYEQYIDTLAATGVNLGAASFALFDVPEGHMHVATTVENIIAEGGTCTADIGITGGDVDCLLDGVDLNGAVGLITSSVAAAHGSAGATGGYVTPDGGQTFSLLMNNAADLAKFRVTSVWIDVRGSVTQMGDTA